MTKEYMKELLINLRKRAQKLNLWDSISADRHKLDRKVEHPALYASIPNLWLSEWEPEEREARTEARGASTLTYCEEHPRGANSPFASVPSCSIYKGFPQKYDWLTEIFGVTRRLGAQTSQTINGLNHQANRYLRYRVNLLGWLRDLGLSHQYWRLGWKLMRSDVYLVSSFNRVCEGWYYKMSLGEIEEILSEVKSIVDVRATRIDIKRVYIPKANGKLRPLGVPSVPWRVYLHMLNNLIVWWRMNQDQEVSQHAYFPGKGVNTAWAELWSKIWKEESIYEFDLVSFFDSVDLRYNEEKLKALGIPPEVAAYLRALNESLVKIKGEALLDESANVKVLENSDGTPNPNHGSLFSEEGARWLVEKEGWSRRKKSGVPQGAATSCSLSTVSLRELFEERFPGRLTMYADDGVCFPENGKEDPDLSIPAGGILKSEEKSFWLKRNGVWERPLKYLGLMYDPVKETMKAATRQNDPERPASKLEYTVDKQFLNYLDTKRAELAGSQSPVGTWLERKAEEFLSLPAEERVGQLFNSNLGPFMVSRLYLGEWNAEVPSDSGLKYSAKSWIHLRYGSWFYDYLCSWKLFGTLKAIQKQGADKELLEGLEQYRGSRSTQTREGKQRRMERHLSELVNRGIRLSPRTIEAFRLEHGEALGESSSEVEGIPTLGELLSFASERAEGLRLMALRTMFRLRRGEDQLNMYLRGLSPVDQRALERAREIWRVLLARLDLTTSNASTMACNDLLEALSSKGRTRLLSHWWDTGDAAYLLVGRGRHEDLDLRAFWFYVKKKVLEEKMKKRRRASVRRQFRNEEEERQGREAKGS